MEERFTVSDKIIHVQQLLSQRERILFRDLFPEYAGRTEIVVTFLALLELIRLHQVQAVQDEVFGEIQLVKAVPVYETSTSSEEEPGREEGQELPPTPSPAPSEEADSDPEAEAHD